MKQWKIAVIALLAFCAGGVALAGEEMECVKKTNTTTVYEITIVAESGSTEKVRGVKDALEKREAFAASGCEAKELDRGAEAHLAYSCTKSDGKTDELFRDLLSLPGVSLQAVTTKAKAINSASQSSFILQPPSTDISCPHGCTLLSSCTGGAYITCCKIPAPLRRCATGSW